MVMTTDNTTTTTTVNLPIHNPEQSAPLPSPAPHSHNSNMSPLTAILSLLVLIAIPALIYAFFFAIHCPRIPLRRPRRQRQAVDLNKDSKQIELVSSGVTKYKKEADHEEEHGCECPVCLSVFVEGDLLRQLSACKHSFHVACIDKWLCSHSNCPVCRASVPILTPTGRPKRPAQRAEEDFQQGLPDAASLV